jgi:hypothetical protein
MRVKIANPAIIVQIFNLLRYLYRAYHSLRPYSLSLGLHKTPFQALIPFLQFNSVGRSFNSTRAPLYFPISRIAVDEFLYFLSLSLNRTGLSVLTTIDKFGKFKK